MTFRLLIIGAGAQARYVIETTSVRIARVIGLIDTFENREYWGRQIDGVKCLGERPVWSKSIRRLISKSFWPSLTRKRSNGLPSKFSFWPSLRLDRSSICDRRHRCRDRSRHHLNAGVVIERGSRLGAHVIVHAGCVIEHDNVVEDFANLAPGVVTAGAGTHRTGRNGVYRRSHHSEMS